MNRGLPVMRVCDCALPTAERRGKMAADEEGRKLHEEHAKLNLTITEDHNTSTKESSNHVESDESAELYKNGFSLAEYYKLCLKYYHKGLSRCNTNILNVECIFHLLIALC